jgi:hypothetical protein
MKVLLVGEDVGVATPLSMVQTELLKKGDYPISFFRETVSIMTLPSTTMDITLVGMSSSAELAKYEMEAILRSQLEDVPFCVFSDIHGAWKGRQWFHELRQKAAGIFVLNEREVAEAKQMYPQAKVYGYGNPRWAEFFNPQTTRAEVREKLGIRVEDNLTRVILVPGGKDLAVNLLHFEGVAKAVAELEPIYKVVISLHPGDKNPTNEYHKLASKYSFLQITDKNFMSGDDLVPGANVVVQSASTVGGTATCQRIPVINYFTDKALERLFGNVVDKIWEQVKLGVEVQVINNIMDLASAIISYCGEGSTSRLTLIQHQEKEYPHPKKNSARLIAEALHEIAGK